MDNNGLVGVNQRIIDGELARKKEEYLNHEELAKIAKLYDSNEVKSIPIGLCINFLGQKYYCCSNLYVLLICNI